MGSIPSLDPTTLPTPLQHTHTHTHNTDSSILNTRFSRFQLERDQRTEGLTDRWTDQRTDKASHTVACPQQNHRRQETFSEVRIFDNQEAKNEFIFGLISNIIDISTYFKDVANRFDRDRGLLTIGSVTNYQKQ